MKLADLMAARAHQFFGGRGIEVLPLNGFRVIDCKLVNGEVVPVASTPVLEWVERRLAQGNGRKDDGSSV